MADKLRVGVIGTGYVSKNNYLPVLAQTEDIEFVGVMAKNYENAVRAATSGFRGRFCFWPYVFGALSLSKLMPRNTAEKSSFCGAHKYAPILISSLSRIR